MSNCYNRCEVCLGFVEPAERDGNKPCPNCGHKTPYLTSVVIQNWILAAGRKKIAIEYKMALSRSMNESGPTMMRLGNEIVEMTPENMVGAIDSVIIEKLASRAQIEAAGIDELLRVAEWEKWLIGGLMSRELSFEQIIAIVTYLYDVETDEMAEIVVQNRRDDFYLSRRLSDIAPEELIYSDTRNLVIHRDINDMTFVIAGDASLLFEPVAHQTYVVRVVLDSASLAIIHDSGNKDEKKLLIFN